MLRTPRSRTVISKERYTLQGVEAAFPGGEWVEDSPPRGDAVKEGVPVAGEPAPSLTVIGGTKYDADALTEYLSALPEQATVYVGAGRGVESDLAKSGDPRVHLVDLDPDRFGKLARKVNVPDVLIQDIHSTVVLVGSGERVKTAQGWLSRARWGREVVEL